MIIEIGTSDFKTKAGLENGLFIEPIKEYFDRLPDCKKENVAVSNYTGTASMYYIPSHIIGQYNLPFWLRGCNSIDKPHPTVESMGLSKYVAVERIKVARIKDLIDKYGIKEISLLKIDTEGHDCVILNDFLDTSQIRPKTIQFENNMLSNPDDIDAIVRRLGLIGYKCTPNGYDMICQQF